MKQLLSILLWCSITIAYSQPPDSIEYIPIQKTFDDPFSLLYTGKVPIHYFPFYNGLQLIEVDYYAHSLAEGRHLDMVQPRGGSWYDDALRASASNGYLLRNRDGKIIQNFGVEHIRKLDLRPPDKAPVITHKSRLDAGVESNRFSVYPGYAPSRRNGYAYIYRDEEMTFTLIDTFGMVRLEKYAYISYADSCYIVGNGEKCGLFDDQFKQRIPFKYVSLQLIDEDTFLAYDGMYTFIDKDDELLDTTHYANIYFPGRYTAFLTYRLDDNKGKCGLMDRKLNRITPPVYEWVEMLHKKGYYATDTSNRMALLNDQGKQITGFKYTQRKPEWRDDGYWLVMERDDEVTRRFYFGLLDSNGREVLPAKYDAIDRLYKGFAVVTKEGKKGLINEHGEELTKFEYDDMRFIGESYYTVRKGTLNGVIDVTGKLVIPIEYKYIHCVGDSMAFVNREDNKKAYIDINTGKQLPEVFDGGGCFVEGRAQILKNKKQGLIDKTGKEYTNFVYDIIFSYNEGQWLVKKDNKFGAIDRFGKVIVPLEYTDIKRLSNGDVRFSNGNKMKILKKEER